jgi:hypothetical protein
MTETSRTVAGMPDARIHPQRAAHAAHAERIDRLGRRGAPVALSGRHPDP